MYIIIHLVHGLIPLNIQITIFIILIAWLEFVMIVHFVIKVPNFAYN